MSLARSEFDRLDKQKLRREMYREQRSLCIYCEREIAEGYPTPRIDHWRPLSLDPGLALHWKNLYLSCTTPDTCDSAKGDRPFRWDDAGDPHMPWPVDLRYEDVVGFTSRGEIYVRSDVAFTNLASADATRRALELAIAGRHNGDRVRRSIVNLNHPALIAARSAAVDGERTRMREGLQEQDRDQGRARGSGPPSSLTRISFPVREHPRRMAAEELWPRLGDAGGRHDHPSGEGRDRQRLRPRSGAHGRLALLRQQPDINAHLAHGHRRIEIPRWHVAGGRPRRVVRASEWCSPTRSRAAPPAR